MDLDSLQYDDKLEDDELVTDLATELEMNLEEGEPAPAPAGGSNGGGDVPESLFSDDEDEEPDTRPSRTHHPPNPHL